MEAYLTEIIVAVVGSLFLAISGFAVKQIKDWLGLDPDGQALNTLEKFEEIAYNWVINEAEKKGSDLSIPETRWEIVNNAVDRLIPKVPKLMSFLNYDKDDLVDDLESLVKNSLEKVL